MNERIFQQGDKWFFHLRGNQISGPFLSYDLAESALNKHVDQCRNRSTATFQWPRNLLPGRLFRRAAIRQSSA
ncbi:MAG: hypothetical protein H6993_09545 [Pseudomonadales bacterium]|nr:hypothetical protein [Pseudomonadales bacterium]